MSKHKDNGKHFCRICGAEIQPGQPVEWAKFKGTTYYVHTDCLKKEGGGKG